MDGWHWRWIWARTRPWTRGLLLALLAWLLLAALLASLAAALVVVVTLATLLTGVWFALPLAGLTRSRDSWAARPWRSPQQIIRVAARRLPYTFALGVDGSPWA